MLDTYKSDFEDIFESEDAPEDYEVSDEAAEWDERSRRQRGRVGPSVRTPPRGDPVAKQSPTGYALKAELAATARKLDGRIGVLSTSLTKLGHRTRALEVENGRIGAALRKEIVTRKKTTDDLRRTLDETRQIAMLMPLLSSPGSVTVGGTTYQVSDGDTFSKLLPILMFSSTGASGSGSGGGLFGGDNSGMMMAVLAIALSGNK